MPFNRFRVQLLSAKSAQHAQGLIPGDTLSGARELAVYVVFSAPTTAGQVLVEGAHDPNYTGTWATLGTVNWAVGAKCHLVAITGAHIAVRVRISTAIADGTVDAHAVGN